MSSIKSKEKGKYIFTLSVAFIGIILVHQMITEKSENK